MPYPLDLASVRETIIALMSTGYPTVRRTARSLRCSPRTLQRRLQEAGVTYGQLVDRVRMDTAQRLLSDPTLHLFEVAEALGFADPSSFSRFFRRMRGVAPRECRSSTTRP